MAQPRTTKRQLPTAVIVVAAIVAVVVLMVFGRFCSNATTIDVTVNGAKITMHGAKDMNTAIRESGLPINPGDLISLKGNVLKRSAGYPFRATVNGVETADPDYVLRSGDVIEVTDGDDMVEEYDAVQSSLPHDATVVGMGPICTIEPGSNGVQEHRTGKISGEEIDRVTQEATEAHVEWFNVDVGDDKVIALTFDEGPSRTYTDKILDVLDENNAKATFFFVGEQVEEFPDPVNRAWFDYQQVCTGTYDREITVQSSADWLAEELRLGREAIAKAVGARSVNPTTRFPNAMLTSSMAAAIDSETNTVVGWTLDTGDGVGSSEETIYSVLMEAQPGDIVVMRDGGGDRTNTVSALKKALPELTAKGYSFITIDQLLKYPHAG